MRVLQDHNEVEIHLNQGEADILYRILESSAVEDWDSVQEWEADFVRGLEFQINNILIVIEAGENG